ncbi:MAG: NUDIX hydrolase [Bacteroidales bacterium]|nr:NUDIX hydrolase [Bacteroidales bacterium]
MAWKQLGKEYLIRNRWITVRKDHVLQPSGLETDDFYVIERPRLVHVIAITEEGDFIFEKQYRYAINRDCLEICAGGIEPDETPMQAAQRELLEETGYAGGEWSLLSEYAVDPSNMTEISYSFLVKGVTKVSEQHLEKTETIEVVLLSEDEVKQALINGSIVSSLMAAPLWQYLYSKHNCK